MGASNAQSQGSFLQEPAANKLMKTPDFDKKISCFKQDKGYNFGFINCLFKICEGG